jgi:predicted amino acid-binding ACT domain protein
VATVLPSAGPLPSNRCGGEPYVVTVAGEDKPGIVRRLTRCFAERDVNIEDVWNEVREGQFTVIFHVTLPPAVDAKELRYVLEQASEEVGVRSTMQHQDIFTATNTLSMRTSRPAQGA